MIKRNNVVFTLLLSFLFASCGGPKEASPLSETSSIDNGMEMIEYSEIILDFDEGVLFNLPPSVLVVEASPNRFAYQPIVIRNDKRANLNISIDSASLSLLSGVEVENNCPTVLPRKQSCYVSIYVNRDSSLGSSQSLSETDLILNLDGVEFMLPVQAQTNAGLDLDIIASEKIELSRNSIDYGLVYEGRSRAEIIILKNNSSRLELPIEKDYSSLTMAEEVYSSCPVNNLLKRRSACFIMIQTKNNVLSGIYSESFSLAGKSIALSANIEISPDIVSNNNVLYNKLSDYIFNDINREFVLSVTNDTEGNQSLYYDFKPIETEFSLIGLDYPEAFSLRDQCPNKTALQQSTCFITMSYDPSRFHFGVVYEKEISFNDELMTLSFEGTSPCSNPASPMYQPGTKLSQDKQSCVPNVGVFDSPDSVFGHAVFQ